MTFPFHPRLRFLGMAISIGTWASHGSPAAASDQGANPSRWRYETMRPTDLEAAIRTRAIAWLVLSPLEWHGEAIAFSSDPVVGQAVAARAWEQAGGVLIPTLYIGTETDYKVWEKDGLATYTGMEIITKERNPGSLYVRPITLELVARDYLTALQREGFKVCVVITGHGALEHVQILEEVCAQRHGEMKVLFWRAGGHKGLPEELQFPDAGPHADVSEASLVGGIDPALVDRNSFGVSERDRKTGLRHENAPLIDFAKGRAVIEDSARRLAEKVESLYPPEIR